MNNLRLKILKKIAQATTTQSINTPSVLGPVPSIPGDLLAHLNEGYNAATVPILTNLVNILNAAMHYASNGQDNFNKIVGNNLDLSAADPDQKNVTTLAKKVYETFLNRKNPFANKLAPNVIHNWADSLTNSSEYNNLSQVKLNSLLATKLQGNLKTEILNLTTQIKQQNP